MESAEYDVSVKEMAEFKTEDYQQYLKTFKAMDKDHSGYIERNELNDLLKSIGYRDFTEEDCEKFLSEADLNKDGKISFKEFLIMMKKIGKKEETESEKRLETKQGKGMIRLSLKGTKQELSYGYSSFSEEERTAYVKVLNSALADDAVCQKYLPIDPDTNQVFERLKNGILLCYLINKAVPGTIDERVINKKDNMNVFQATENLNLGLSAARSIGVRMSSIDAGTFRDEDKISILGVLWQIVKQVVLVKITLKNYPQLVRLLNEGEQLSDLLKLSPEELLLRWFNYHLKAAEYPKPIHNFSADIKDSEKYTVLLHQLDKEHCDTSALQESDLVKRAEKVLENSRKVGAESYITPNDIVSGNNNLNLLFTAAIFNSCHGLDPPTEQEAYDAAKLLDDDAEGSREERAYRMWLNSLGITEGNISNLYEESKDGILLCKVLDKIRPGCVEWKKVDKKAKNSFTKGVNCQQVIESSKKNGYKIVGVGNLDILKGDKKMILAVVWQIFRDHTLQLIGGKTEEELVQWGNSVVSEEYKIKNLKDKSLSNGLYFIDICKYIEPRAIDWDIVIKGSNEDADKESNAKYVISVARKLGALVFLVWEDIKEVKSKMLLTLMASLYQTAQTYKK